MQISSTGNRIIKNKSKQITLVSVYFFSLSWGYVFWLSPLFYYIGFTYNPENHSNLWIGFLIALSILFFIPNKIKKPSEFVIWVMYFMLFIPIICFVPIQDHENFSPSLFMALMCLSMILITLVIKINIKIPHIRISKKYYFAALWLLFIAMIVFIVVSLRGSLRFASLDDIYTQRELGGEKLSSSNVAYLTAWISNAVAPVMMAIAIIKKSKPLFFAACAGFIIVYMTAALKSVILSIIILPLFYYIMMRKKALYGTNIGFFLASILVFTVSMIEVIEFSTEGILSQLMSLILMRTYGIGPTLTGIYTDFFAVNPTTGYSHINIVRLFVSYPYDESVGQVIAREALNLPGVNANANFWATDGVAALGIWGLPVAGILFGLGLLAVDTLTARVDKRIVCIALLPFLMSIFNSSLFTSFLTGGGALVALLLYFYGGVRKS